MEKVKSIIFDMDGVLIDSEIHHYRHRIAYFNQLGLKLSKAQVGAMSGGNMHDLWPKILPNQTSTRYEQLQTEYLAFKAAHPIDYQKVFKPEMKQLIQWLAAHKFQLGLASSSNMPTIQHVLEINQIKPYFSQILSGTDFLESKPNPEIYLTMLDKLQTSANQAVALEDSKMGIEAAKRAGLTVFAVPVPYSEVATDQSEADYELTTIRVIQDYLEKRDD